MGAILVGFARAQAFSPEDRALLLDLGQQYAEAVLRSRQYAADQQARAELELRVDERTRELVAINVTLSREIEQRKTTEGQLAASLEQLRAVLVDLPHVQTGLYSLL